MRSKKKKCWKCIAGILLLCFVFANYYDIAYARFGGILLADTLSVNESEASGGPERSNEPETSNKPEASSEPEASNKPEISDEPKASDELETPGESEVHNESEVPDESEVPSEPDEAVEPDETEGTEEVEDLTDSEESEEELVDTPPTFIFEEGEGTEENPFIIADAEAFDHIRDNLTAVYRLAGDIDFGGENLIPIGELSSPFAGGLDGAGYTLRNFKINGSDYTGLFGYADTAKLKSLIIDNAEIGQNEQHSNIGVLAGLLKACTVENISLTDIIVTGDRYVGGLAGYIDAGTIKNIDLTDTAITGGDYTGGLAGYVKSGEATRCAAIGGISVTGGDYTGGLIGFAVGSSTDVRTVSECGVVGSVAGRGNVGGLAGHLQQTAIGDSFAIVDVISITGGGNIVGLAGSSQGAAVMNCYAAGSVSEGGSGLTGTQSQDAVTVTSSFFNSVAAGVMTPETQAKTPLEMCDKDTYVGWDWENIWTFQENTYPKLKNVRDISFAIDLQMTFELDYHGLTYDSVVIDWQDIQGATEYEILYFDSSAENPSDESADKPSSKTEKVEISEASIEGLSPDTEYEFKVRAQNSDGILAESMVLKLRTKQLAEKVVGVHSTGKTQDSITLTWERVKDTESYEVIYNNRILSVETNTCTLTRLRQDTPYVIYVRALVTDGVSVIKKISSPIMEKIYTIDPKTDYAREFISKCDGQTWFIDEVENLLSLKGKSINTINSKNDFATIYAIGLAGRGLEGEIPVAIGELFNLEYLYLGNNSLSGEVPGEIEGLANLIEVDLSNNEFSDGVD